jgi:hypothetical protein
LKVENLHYQFMERDVTVPCPSPSHIYFCKNVDCGKDLFQAIGPLEHIHCQYDQVGQFDGIHTDNWTMCKRR